MNFSLFLLFLFSLALKFFSYNYITRYPECEHYVILIPWILFCLFFQLLSEWHMSGRVCGFMRVLHPSFCPVEIT